MASPARVLVYPAYATNPWTGMLYERVRDIGLDVVLADTLDEFRDGIRALGVGDVAHVQWLSAVADGRPQPIAKRRAAQFCAAVLAAKRRGVTVVWSVHNVIAHDATNPGIEIELARFLAANADAVHLLNPATAAIAAPLYDLPEGAEVIGHSSYAGVYLDTMTRDEARATFGLRPDDLAVLHFGQPRPFKGTDELRSAAEGLDGVVLLMPDVRVDDDDVQRWFRAADVTALPYRDVLNSGTAMLSATFGVPVLVPKLPALEALLEREPWTHWYEPGELAGALRTVAIDRGESAAALRFAEQRPPRAMADAFCELIERARLTALADSR